MTGSDRPGRPARLPRERDQPRPSSSSPPAAPSRPPRGLSRGMKVVLIGTLVVMAMSLVMAKCATTRGRPTRARTHWNAPPVAARQPLLDDLRAQAEERARRTVPGAVLARITARRVDPGGHVDLEYGSAGFELVAPPGAAPPDGTPCGVEQGISWQGWAQRPRRACSYEPLTPRCTFAAALAKAYPSPPSAVQLVLEIDGGAQTWTFWSLDEDPPEAVAVPDDC